VVERIFDLCGNHGKRSDRQRELCGHRQLPGVNERLVHGLLVAGRYAGMSKICVNG
jgi:hypothetical protein